MTKQPSPSQLARSERMRVAAIEGAKARADYKASDIAVRKNMERLRALRLAKEAEEAARPQTAKIARKKRVLKASAKANAGGSGSLSDWIQAEKGSGRTT